LQHRERSIMGKPSKRATSKRGTQQLSHALVSRSQGMLVLV